MPAQAKAVDGIATERMLLEVSACCFFIPLSSFLLRKFKKKQRDRNKLKAKRELLVCVCVLVCQQPMDMPVFPKDFPVIFCIA